MNNNFDWKKPVKIILRILLILIIILSVAVVSLAGTFFFIRWHADVSEKASGDKNFIENLVTSEKKQLKPNVTCLFLGINGNLTDFIMLGQYDPNTREIDLVSIPRDTNVGNASVDGKINSVYSSRSLDKLKEEVTRITGIDINYYVLFKTKVLRDIVDEMGGVTVDVPINMNYDDPYQNLHIHLNKGVQKLNGSQAEQFCRFRQNNNGTGYPGGDVERTKAQQKFVKSFIGELLKGENISKLSTLIGIAVDNTKTDITLDIAKNYIGDAIALRTDRIYTNTLPGSARMGQSQLGYQTSYYYLDYEQVKNMIDEMFYNKVISSGEKISETSSSSVISTKTLEDAVRVELLNAGTSAKVINELVDKLKEDNFYVVKIGNYETTKTEVSRIIDYGTGSSSVLDKLKKIIDISKVEDVEGKSSVDYTIIIGPNYK
ncbi:MAG: LCP family protein [Clostridia bacterium]|nr:LCP family protein [Clostridia bacterium]